MLLQLLLQMPFSERQPVTVLNRAVTDAVADDVAVADAVQWKTSGFPLNCVCNCNIICN